MKLGTPALLIAAALAYGGLAVVATPGEPAHAEVAPAMLECVTSNPYTRSIPVRNRDAYSVMKTSEGMATGVGGTPVGGIDYLNGVVNAEETGLAGIPSQTRQGGMLVPMAAATSAHLTGLGSESIVRVTGVANTAPSVAIESYSEGEPTTSALTTTQTNLNIPAAGAVAITAADFDPTPADKWLAGDLVEEPEEVAIAWRGAYDAQGPENITIGLFRPTADGRSLVEYGTRTVIPGDFYSPHHRLDALSLTSADLDMDGDQEIVVGYTWGEAAIDENARLAVYTITNPQSPRLVKVADRTLGHLDGQHVSQVTVATGFFGDRTPEIVVAWEEYESGSSTNTHPVRVLGLPAAASDTDYRQLSLKASRDFTTGSTDSSRAYATFALAVGDVDHKPLAPGKSVLTEGKDEIVVVMNADNAVQTSVLRPNTQGLSTMYSVSDSAFGNPNRAMGIGMAIADVDADADGDVVVAYGNPTGTVTRVMWQAITDDRQDLVLRSSMNSSMGYRAGNFQVVTADVGNLAQRMLLRRGNGSGPVCLDIESPRLISVADAPPFWQTPSQLNWWGYTTVGGYKSAEAVEDRAVTQTAGSNLTVGVGVDFDYKWVEVELAAQYDISWEASTTEGHADSESVTLMESQTNFDYERTAQYGLVGYRCYYYELVTPTGTSSSDEARACVVDPEQGDVTTGQQGAFEWETGQAPGAATDDFAWAPFRPEWTDLTLLLPPAAATTAGSGVGLSPGRAIDAGKDPRNAGTVFTSLETEDPYWLLKLDAETDVGLVRVTPGALDACGAADQCQDLLRDFDVYVIDGARSTLAYAAVADLQAAVGSGVERYHFEGAPARVANMVTRSASTWAPAKGKYIRVQMNTDIGVLQLADVAVYAAEDRLKPPDHPCGARQLGASEQATVPGEKAFVVSVYDRSQQKCVDRIVSGELVTMTPAPHWVQVSNGVCDAYQGGAWSSDETDSRYFEKTTNETQGVGSSGDFSYGPEVFQVKGSVAFSRNWGTENKAATTTSVGKGFTIDWGRGNFCKRDANGNRMQGWTTAGACNYKLKPFYYASEEWSNSGYQQLFPHVSYLVEMDRWRDLTDCHEDYWRDGPNIAPQADDMTLVTSGPAVVDPLKDAIDAADKLRLVIRGVARTATLYPVTSAATESGGVATVVAGKVSYEPPPGAWNTDTFYVTISDHDLSKTLKVTIYHPGISNGDFSSGLAGWVKTGTVWSDINSSTDGRPLPGKYVRGVVPPSGGTGSLSQTVVMPSSGTGTLTVWRRMTRAETGTCGAYGPLPVDRLEVRATSGATSTVLETMTNAGTSCTWAQAQYNLAAFKGKVVELKFTGSGSNDGWETDFDIDGVSLS